MADQYMSELWILGKGVIQRYYYPTGETEDDLYAFLN